jgi:iron complex transport system ATP-binding protein
MDVALEQVTVDVNGARLVERLDLRVASGEVVGLLGPNGSGKSTALRCVFRALSPTGGVVRVGGDDVEDLRLRESARRVAALTQESASELDFTVRELVALGRAPHRRGNRPLTTPEAHLCEATLERLDITHLAERGMFSLSGGERQRALIARALVQEPRVLVLDEPTNHLDVRHQVHLLRSLRGLGPTVLIVLHDLNLAAAVCDRIGLLDAGRLAAVGPPREVLTEATLRRIFGVETVVVDHPLTREPQILFDLRDLASSPTGKA